MNKASFLTKISLIAVMIFGVMVQARAQTPTGKDLAGSAGLSENHTTLLAALKAAGLADQASAAGPFTVFAPDNAAFDKLPEGTVATLLKPENKKTLSGILLYHVVQGAVLSSALKDGQVIKTVNGASLTVRMKDGKVMLEDTKGGMSTVTAADIQATNGVVHSIDSVLMP
ncbi:fasciclin domain-containing protein [Arundinibacter roseus]|uniref:Fasciclin domain-containing protein n=1 Tax=Arundinibacter roseus TaxID=2070510 RepID=A0A4R4K1F4_9BACT|nr:fasciclin domain-containing protein [Arundinibacter roseus]TDB61117.1 fasciclin domain-containing protein [Arundinibacter roseus]